MKWLVGTVVSLLPLAASADASKGEHLAYTVG
jgi:hypothetical protein